MESNDSPQATGQLPEKTPLLPLWAIVGNAYSTAWGYRAEYIKIIWCWLVIAIPIMCIYNWFFWPSLEPVFCLDFAHLPDKAVMHENTHRVLITMLPVSLLRILIGASIAVAWHRLILRHEKIANAPYLRLDGVVLDYFIFGLCFWLLSMLSNVLSTLFDNHALFSLVLMLTASILVLILTVRLSIILPARALELKNVTLKDVWLKTSWNFWRLFWATLFCMIPGIPFFFLTRMGCGSSIAGPVMYGLCTLLGIVIVAPVVLAFLSLSYQHFFERRNAA